MSTSPPLAARKSSATLASGSERGFHNGIRKRTRKACDRCRLKKGKCDGSYPCSRCKADNLVCCFSETKRAHGRNHPRGYADMLERQQNQLVSGLQMMYFRLQKASLWKGAPLCEDGSEPLTHDILAALDLLEVKEDDSGEMGSFEETSVRKRLDSGCASSLPGLPRFDLSNNVIKNLEWSSSTNNYTPTPPDQSISSLNAASLVSSAVSTSAQQQWRVPREAASEQTHHNAHQHHPRPLSAKPTTLQTTQRHLPPNTKVRQQSPASQYPALFEDDLLSSPDQLQQVSACDEHYEADVDAYETAPHFNRPLDLVHEPSLIQEEPIDSSKLPLWQRRLRNSIVFDGTDFMSDFDNLSPLDATGVNLRNFVKSQEIVL